MSEEDTELNQKSITELQNEIKEYQKRERVYIIDLLKKDEKIRQLDSYKKSLIEKVNSSQAQNKYLDPIVLNQFKILKSVLKEKDAMLLSREEELFSLQGQNKNQFSTKFMKKCGDIHKENLELFGIFKNSTIENMRMENSLEKSQIEQLMLKLKESESIMNDYENDIDESNEIISFLGRKIKREEELVLASNSKSKK